MYCNTIHYNIIYYNMIYLYNLIYYYTYSKLLANFKYLNANLIRINKNFDAQTAGHLCKYGKLLGSALLTSPLSFTLIIVGGL